jgi:hypothetical protein
MPYLIGGLLLLWLASAAMKGFVRANPAAMARMLRKGATLASVGLALLMLLRGRFDIALPLLGLGFWLGKLATPGRSGFFAGAGRRRARKVSRVRSAMIEMELDRVTGTMSGTVLAGPDEGAILDQLSEARCLKLYDRCLADDPDGARLLESYLDRRFAGWRETADHRTDPGRGQSSAGEPKRAGFMSEDEAHEVLGVSKRATREEITRAHRALMKKLHPDHGGSTDLAARVNEAKDVLLRRHP